MGRSGPRDASRRGQQWERSRKRRQRSYSFSDDSDWSEEWPREKFNDLRRSARYRGESREFRDSQERNGRPEGKRLTTRQLDQQLEEWARRQHTTKREDENRKSADAKRALVSPHDGDKLRDDTLAGVRESPAVSQQEDTRGSRSTPLYRVVLSGVDTSVSNAHLFSIVHQLTRSRPECIRRPALETLSHALQTAQQDFVARQEGKGVLSLDLSQESPKVSSSPPLPPHTFRLPFLPSPELIAQTARSVDASGMGGTVLLDWDAVESATAAANALNGAQVNGRFLSTTMLQCYS